MESSGRSGHAAAPSRALRSFRAARLIVTRFAIAALVSSGTAHAQDASSVSGRLVKPGGDSVIAVSDAWVTLHRVGTDHAGPVDSTRTGPAGNYTINYRRTGATDAIYFVASSHDGVAYFSHPLTARKESGPDAEIVVFDTTSRPIPVTVRGRHLIISRASSDGTRTVTEVFELSNDTSVTRIAPNESAAAAVWSSLIPAKAMNPAVSDGDVPAAAVRFADASVLMYAPLAPGIKQLAFHYDLPSDAFPLHVRIERGAVVLEVLAEDSAAMVSGARLRAVPPVAIERHQFHRYLAGDVPPNAVVVIDLPDVKQPPALYFVAGLTLVIGGAMTIALARALRRR